MLGRSCTPGDTLAFREDSVLCLLLQGCMAVPRLGGAHASGPCILLMEAGVETWAGASLSVSEGNTPPVTATQPGHLPCELASETPALLGRVTCGLCPRFPSERGRLHCLLAPSCRPSVLVFRPGRPLLPWEAATPYASVGAQLETAELRVFYYSCPSNRVLIHHQL